MAVITNTIGTATRDYSTIALWEAALPASAVTAGNSYVGQCYNDSEFNLSTTQLVLAGTTTDATHTITLTTGPGQSFRDNAGAATNALRYNVSNGVGITGALAYVDAIRIDEANVTLSNLQIKNTATNGGSFALQSTFSNGSNFVLDSCILECSAGTGTTSSVIIFGGTNQKATNCLFVLKSSGTSGGLIFTQDGSLINCDIVRPTNFTAGGAAAKTGYNGITIQNCATVGFTTIVNNPGSRTLTGSGNATDQASFPTGLTGQVSLTIATEFVQPSNGSSVMDWRLNSTSVACKDNGTNSGAPTTDIIGQAISNTTRDVGAWELQQGGGGTVYSVSISEAGSAGDAETVTATFAAAGSETGIAIDVSSVTAVFAATDTEAGSAADVTTGGNSTPAAITESGTATDAETVTATFAPSITEAGAASDTDVATAVFVASETEAGSASDSPSAAAVFVASDTEAATATDSENTQNQGSVTETATAAETETATVVFAADISEAGTATDTSSNAAIFVAAASEPGTADDVTAANGVFVASDTEAAAAIDLSNAAIPGPPSTDTVHGNPFFSTPGPMTTIQ